MMEMLKKKTTRVGIATILLAIADLFWGGDPEIAIGAIMLGLAMITGRHAIAKGK